MQLGLNKSLSISYVYGPAGEIWAIDCNFSKKKTHGIIILCTMEIKNNFYKQIASGRLDFIMSGKQQKSTITTNNTGLCEECAYWVCVCVFFDGDVWLFLPAW